MEIFCQTTGFCWEIAMSKKYLELLIQELKSIRIACKGNRDGKPCQVIIEIPLECSDGFFPKDKCKCPWCEQSFYPQLEGISLKNPFNPLAEAIRCLLAIQDKVSVTFVVEESAVDPVQK
jgi:hypothetical protein